MFFIKINLYLIVIVNFNFIIKRLKKLFSFIIIIIKFILKNDILKGVCNLKIYLFVVLNNEIVRY